MSKDPREDATPLLTIKVSEKEEHENWLLIRHAKKELKSVENQFKELQRQMTQIEDRMQLCRARLIAVREILKQAGKEVSNDTV